MNLPGEIVGARYPCLAAEMLGVRSGLGYQILNARDQLAYDQVTAVILVIGVLGYVLDVAARRLLGRITPRSK